MNVSASTWRFPRAFWTANLVELCERAAYYGSFIVLTVYLSRVVGMRDSVANIVGALFGALIYLFPFFTGAVADRMGFRRALILAFGLLTCGYGLLGAFDTAPPVLSGLFLIVLGGSFVKPIITGTVAKSSDAANRARAYSLFYMTVNIGAFLGKTVVKGSAPGPGRGQCSPGFLRGRRWSVCFS
ncbi:MAG: MFS transporter [Acidobacteriota bacterium]|nr:MFS transporter [Acidobacteriota bacterium]